MTKRMATPVNINGEDYLTVQQFSELTNKSESTIRHLMIKGNLVRKLEVVRIGTKPFIPYKELFDFPFVQNGRPNEFGYMVVKYKLEGSKLRPVESFEYNKNAIEVDQEGDSNE